MEFRGFRADSDAPHVSGPFSDVSEPFLMILDVLERKIDALGRGPGDKCPQLSANLGTAAEARLRCPQMSANLSKNTSSGK